jgi:hypothetical protein
MMEDIENQIETLFDRAIEYGKTSIELAKLKAVDKISDIAASLISRIFISAVLIMIFLFASLGLALWLGEIMGKVYLGFFTVAAIYCVLAILTYLFFGKWIKRLIVNGLIRKVLD